MLARLKSVKVLKNKPVTVIIDRSLNTFIYRWMSLIKQRRLCCLLSFTCQAPKITVFDHTILMLAIMALPLWYRAEKQKTPQKNGNL